MKRGGGEESSILADADGARSGSTLGADENSFLIGGSCSGGGGGNSGGDMIFTPGRVVVDTDDQLVRTRNAPRVEVNKRGEGKKGLNNRKSQISAGRRFDSCVCDELCLPSSLVI